VSNDDYMTGDDQQLVDDCVNYLRGTIQLNSKVPPRLRVPVSICGSVRTWMHRYLSGVGLLWGHAAETKEYERLVSLVKERVER
jgi:hypothetical protein